MKKRDTMPNTKSQVREISPRQLAVVTGGDIAEGKAGTVNETQK